MPRPTASALILTTAILVAAGACGTQKAENRDSTAAPTSTSLAAQVTELTITLKKSPSSTPQTWKLTCDPPGGDHPAPRKACAQLAKAGDKAFAPPPSDAVCTEIYGGPEQGTVEGRWRGTKVKATFQRKDGCGLDRWSQVSELFGELPRVR